MPDVNKSVSINYTASTVQLEKALKKIPGITDAQATQAAKELDKNFKKMETSAEGTSKKISAQMKTVGKSFAAVGAAVAATGAAVVTFSQHIADSTNELVDASTKSGIAVETLAGLRLAAEGSGLAFGNLEGGLIKFQSAMDAANQGSKLTADAFKALGVDVADADGNLRDADTVFNEAVSSLGKLENTTERNAKAMILFGRSGGASLIQSGALDNLESMKTLATEFGISVEQDAIGSLGMFQRKMAEFGTVAEGTLQGVFNSIAGKNSINMAIQFTTESMVYLGSVAKDILAVIGQSFENVFVLVQAAYLAMTGEVDRAQVILQDNVRELDTAFTNVGSVFERASDEVAKFQKLSAASTAPQKMQATADATQNATDSMKGLQTASKQVAEQIDLIAESINDAILQNVELEEQLADRLTPEYQKQINQVRQLGNDIEAQINLLDNQVDALIEQSKVRELNADEQHQLLMLTQELDIAEGLAAENRKAEQNELLQLRKDAQKKYLEDVEERLKAEEKIQTDAIQKQQDAINRVADTGSHFVNVLTSLSDLMSTVNEQQIAEFRSKTDKELKAVDDMVKQGVITAQQAAEHKASIEAGYSQKVQELKIKEFKLGQTSAVASIAFDTAKAIAQALVLPPGARGATIAAITAASGLQMASVLAQKPPKFDVGGMVGSSTDNAPDQVNANLLTGEAVLDRTTVRMLQEQGADVRTMQNMPGTGLQRVFIIQPFKHHDRYNKMQAKRAPRRAGSGAY